MRIGLDIDGVLYPWDECARDALVERFGIERPGPSTHWTFLKDVLPGECWRWLWSAEGQDAAFSRVECVYPGTVEMVDALTRNPDNRVHFVTHRDPRRAGYATALFLREHFAAHPWAGVHVLQTSVAKRTLARWDVFVDDKPETVWDFLGYTSAQVFAPVRPWNVDEFGDLDIGPGFVHYTDPAEVVRWVEANGV